MSEHAVVEILDSWPRLGRLLLLICSIAAVGWVLAFFILKNLPSNASELQFGSAKLLFQQPTRDGGTSLLVVSPQGWNRTTILVKEGQFVRIQAGGKVCFDLTGLTKAIDSRREAEIKVAKRVNPALGRVAPEDYFTPNETGASVPAWPWTGPDGVPGSLMSQANPVRRKRSIMPEQPYGVLVGAFNRTDAEPGDKPDLVQELASAAFRVGSEFGPETVRRTGYLYFAINEVQNKATPDMFFADNIGAYFVKVEVSDK